MHHKLCDKFLEKKYSVLKMLGKYLENANGRTDFFHLHLLMKFFILYSQLDLGEILIFFHLHGIRLDTSNDVSHPHNKSKHTEAMGSIPHLPYIAAYKSIWHISRLL